MERVTILGAGMAGFGAAHYLHKEGVKSEIYEKMPYYGGHTASFRHEGGFIFDDGPHVSFTEDARIQQLFAASVAGEYETVEYRVNNYWKGYWIKHPAQCNLFGLPTELVIEILRDCINQQGQNHADPKNYEQWLIASYGETFARTFPMEYTIKYHTTSACNMSTDWLGPRMYRPKLEEVLYGALSPNTANVHYAKIFRYPRRNGFVSFLKCFPKETVLKLNHAVVSIDRCRKELFFADGQIVQYEGLVSSLPLTELIPMIRDVPVEVVEAASKLACSSCVIVNLGIDRAEISQAHISYFYDRDVFFTRLNFPHMMSPNNVPRGAGSIQAEVYFSNKYRPLDRAPEDCVQPVVDSLRKCGLVRADDKILFSDYRVIPYANVIFDLERTEALSVVHGYLDDLGIAYCGRYGDWGYMWTDESFISGERAAERAISK